MTPTHATSSENSSEALRHIAIWQGMVARWNDEADGFRQVARGEKPVSPFIMEEADRTLESVRRTLHLCDMVMDKIAPGHRLMGELFRISGALDALSESLGRSIDQLGPRVQADHDVAGLKYLVSALREDASRARVS
ncbi:hypothetical protein [Devosia sp.]|uniref:hypothetical protein n=1 Tax=Devosia sp. TaxID=1871048 RepID=UPI003A922DBD